MNKHFFSIIICCVFSLTVFAQKKQAKTKLVHKAFALGVVDELKSKELGEQRLLNIYLPEGYQKSDTGHYPVIYLLDGSANEDFVHVAGLVQFMNMIQAMPPSIVVGIGNVDRKRDFTFPTTIAKDLKSYPTTGKSAKFISFLEHELQPYMTKNYRTNGHTTIIGQSLGGLLATEVLITKPQLFDDYIIVSPSLWWNDESLLADAKKMVNTQKYDSIRVVVSVGNEGKVMEDDAATLVRILKGTSSHWPKVLEAPMPGENHATILHRAVYRAFEVLNVGDKK